MVNKIKNQQGFSLLEVMIAITLFAFFVTAYLTGQGYNIEDSRISEEQLILQQLAERKINELIFEPPKFSNATDNSKETKTFEESTFPILPSDVENKSSKAVPVTGNTTESPRNLLPNRKAYPMRQMPTSGKKAYLRPDLNFSRLITPANAPTVNSQILVGNI